MKYAKLDTLAQDIKITAGLAGAPHDAASVRRVLDTFADGFCEHAVEFRTTTKPTRGLSFRFVDLHNAPQDPYKTAIDAGLLSADDHPVHRLLTQVQSAYEIQGWGVDGEVSHGLDKLWPFLKHGYPVDTLAALEAAPASLIAALPTLKAHGFAHFSIIAADFYNRSTNVYFMLQDPKSAAADNTRSLCEALGLHVEARMLEYMSHGVAANLTFDWDNNETQRFCIYVPGPTPADVPADLPAPIPELVAHAPIAAAHRSFIVGPTMTRSGYYVKLEVDYSGTTLPCLQQCMSVMPQTA